MLTVAEEEGPAYAQACMVCPLDREEPRERIFVLLWENDLPVPQGPQRRTGGVLRLCWEHLDELAVLIAEVL